LAEEYSGRLKVAKLNVAENLVMPGKYGIRAVPALLLFKAGAVADQSIGAVSKSAVKEMIVQKAL
jgi:thioredoxin 1